MIGRALLLVLMCGLIASASAEEGSQVILDGSSIWRAHIRWMKVVIRAEDGLAEAHVGGQLRENSEPPPLGWRETDFDDSSWMLWREPRVPRTLRINATGARRPTPEDFMDTGVRLYDPDQYGFFRSIFVGLQCLRGRFVIEDPAKVEELALSVEFRGGIVAYVNGREVGRAYLPRDGSITPDTPAEDYPDEAYLWADDKPMVSGIGARSVPMTVENAKRVNCRIRKLVVKLPTALLEKGTNILALEIHRSPFYANPRRINGAGQLSDCGVVSVELRGRGAIVPAVGRPKGLQVWNANILTRVSPFMSMVVGRITQGWEVYLQSFPLSWGHPANPLAPIRIVGTRGGVFSGQVVVSSDTPIRGLKAEVSDLLHSNGKRRIPASAIKVRYLRITESWPRNLREDLNTSFLDALYEDPPREVPVRAGYRESARRLGRGEGMVTWADEGAIVPVWITVRVPTDVPAGDYQGILTIQATGAKVVSVPVHMKVADWTLPHPLDFVTHMGAVHSSDTLSRYYQVPLWSEEHFRLMEKTLAYMGELGSKVVFLPLSRTRWFQNEQSMIYWVKQADGSYKYDFQVLDRYLDLVQKYLKVEVICLYAFDASVAPWHRRNEVSVLDPSTGKVDTMSAPVPKAVPEAIAFWKPVLAEVMQRLARRGLDKLAMLGLVWEGNTSPEGKEAVGLFKEVAPGMRLVQSAHYGGQGGQSYGVPYGYVMSVWGNRAPVKSKLFGARDLPIKVAWNPRCDLVTDLRPIAHRGALGTALERAAERGTIGLAPIGMDFWILRNPKRPERGYALESAGNLSMTGMGTGALLAPGRDGPVSTARFEILREGLQECEARMLIEKALADESTHQQLGEPLVRLCQEVIAERRRCLEYVRAGSRWAQEEGWRWFEVSGWEGRAAELFKCAGQVARALSENEVPLVRASWTEKAPE